ncbi:MAG: HAD hydrolase-like protein [Acidimicrobiia bacterium]
MTICLFDLDGTLVDSTWPVLTALNAALDDLDLAPVTAEDLNFIIGPPLRATFVTLVAERGGSEATADRLLDAYRSGYRTTSIDLAVSYPGVPELLDDLKGHTRLGVVTSKPTAYAIPILDALGFSSMMEVMEGPGLSETEAKPATLARALDRLGVVSNLESVYMIGDRHHDIEAGRSAGVRTIGVTWGFGSGDELGEAGADYVIDTPDEVSSITLR